MLIISTLVREDETADEVVVDINGKQVTLPFNTFFDSYPDEIEEVLGRALTREEYSWCWATGASLQPASREFPEKAVEDFGSGCSEQAKEQLVQEVFCGRSGAMKLLFEREGDKPYAYIHLLHSFPYEWFGWDEQQKKWISGDAPSYALKQGLVK